MDLGLYNSQNEKKACVLYYTAFHGQCLLLIAEVCLSKRDALWIKQIVIGSILDASWLSIRQRKFLEWPDLLKILITDEEWLIGAK